MKHLLPLLLGLLLALPAAAQMQKGHVKTPGRLGTGGALIPGKRLAGAYVKVRGRQGVRSNDKGDFALPVDRNFYVERAELAGYTVVDRDLLSRRYDYSAGNPLIVVLEDEKQYRQNINSAVRKIRNEMYRQLDKREAEIKRLLEENRITQARYDSLREALGESQEKSDKLVEAMAERYASIDFDQESELNRRISACILNGELSRADSLLRTMGNINILIDELNQLHTHNEKEAEKLKKNLQLEQHKQQQLAFIYYKRYELCLVEHHNDSAAHYLKLRAALDTTNVQWVLDAGFFYMNTQKNYTNALTYYECALRNATKQFGKCHPYVATCYLHMGFSYYRQRCYDKALSNAEKALSIYEYTLPKNALDIIRTDKFVRFIKSVISKNK